MMATILSGYLQWFFRASAVLFLGGSWRHRCGWAVFIKLRSTVFPAISSQCFCVVVFLGITYYLGAAIFQGIFQLQILTFIYYYIYIIIHIIIIFILLSTSVQSFLHGWGFYNCHIRTLLQCPVLFYLIWLICCCRLIYLVLFYYRSHLRFFSHKILAFCLKLTVKIVKNILCNGFKTNVNKMN